MMVTSVAFSILVLVGLLAYYQWQQDVDILASFQAVDPIVIPAALACHMGAHVWWAVRLRLMAQGLGDDMKWTEAWGTVTAGLSAAAVTPGRIGGEGLKMALLIRRGRTPSMASQVLLADRAADLVFFLIMGALATLLLPGVFGAGAGTVAAYTTYGLAAMLVFVLMLAATLAFPDQVARVVQVTSRPVARVLRKRWDLEDALAHLVRDVRLGLRGLATGSVPRLVAAAALSVANWVTDYGALWFLLRGFGFDVPFLHVVLVGVVLTMVASIPVTPGGSGVAEVSALILLTPLAPGLTAAFVVLWRAVTYYYDLLVGSIVAAKVWQTDAGPNSVAEAFD